MEAWSDRYWISRDGLRLHYRDYDGPADRPPILCLHGLTRNARDFESLAQRYAGAWRVIAPDFRGRAMSDNDPNTSNYTPRTYASDTVQLLDEQGIAEAVFVGTSLGGLTAMVVAAIAPQRIAAAVLNDVGPELDSAGLERISTYVGKPLVFESWEQAADAFQGKYRHVHPRYREADWLRYAKRVCREGEKGIELDYDVAIAEAFSKVISEPVRDAWPLLRALAGRPVLILRGESSDLLQPQAAEKMRDVLPGAELATIPDVGHAPDFEEPETIAAMDRLLQRVLKRA